jgi:uncharacterized delta-60 repeat protein
MMKKGFLITCIYFMNLLIVFGQSGLPDPSFGGGTGYVITNFGQNYNRALSMAVYLDGKVISAGSTQDLAGDDFGADFAIAKYNEDGSPASDFGVNGLVMTDINNESSDVAEDIAILDDGKIMVAGRSHAGTAYEDYHFAIVRYNHDGTLDTSFGTQGKVLYPYETMGDYAYPVKMAIQQDGKIVVTGTCYSVSGFDLFMTVRFQANGQVDSTFGFDGKVITSLGEFCDGQPYSIKIQSDGKILVGGLIHGSLNYPTGVDFALVRYNADGSPDASFGSYGIVITPITEGDGYEWIEDIAIQPDGGIVAAGNTDVLSSSGNLHRVALVRYHPDGTLDNSFGTSGIVLNDFGSSEPYVTGVTLTSYNDIIIGGHLLSQNGNYDFLVAKYSATGSPVQGFGVNGMTTTHINLLNAAMDVQFHGSGKIIMAGLTGDETHHDFAVLRYLDGVHPGKQDLFRDNPVEIFPNPVSEFVSIKVLDKDIFTVSIMNMTGKEVFRSVLVPNINRFNLENLIPGVYVMIFRKNDEAVFCKNLIIKQ